MSARPSDPNELATCRTDLGPLTRKLLEQQQEIERLREQLRLANVDNFNTTAEVERLRAERDEARREVCVAREAMVRMMIYGDVAVPQEAMHQAAKARGWDCFKEGT